MGGGKFEQGFLAAGFTEALSPAISYAGYYGSDIGEYGAAAIAGGVGSEIAGGSFENGAIMGFFSRALNYVLHDNKPGKLYKSRDEAAKAGLDYIMDQCKTDSLEYGGFLYETAGGGFFC